MIILACVIGFLVFLACVGSFSLGFKFGHSVKDGVQPEVKPNLFVKEEKDEKLKEWEEGFNNIMSFDGEENV